MTEATSPKDIMKNWPEYRVATQVNPENDIVIRKVRCPNLTEVLALVRRLLACPNLATLSFFEVHQLNADGSTSVMVGDVNKPWPAKANQRTENVVYSPSPRVLAAADKNEERPAIKPGTLAANIEALRDKASSRAAARVEQQMTMAKAVTTPVVNLPAVAEPSKEAGRDKFIHKRQVA